MTKLIVEWMFIDHVWLNILLSWSTFISDLFLFTDSKYIYTSVMIVLVNACIVNACV